MQGWLVSERRAGERGEKKRAGGAHLADHLPVLRLVADEEVAPGRRDQDGKNEEEDGDGEKALARHAPPIL
jgi:hypothetical protein